MYKCEAGLETAQSLSNRKRGEYKIEGGELTEGGALFVEPRFAGEQARGCPGQHREELVEAVHEREASKGDAARRFERVEGAVRLCTLLFSRPPLPMLYCMHCNARLARRRKDEQGPGAQGSCQCLARCSCFEERKAKTRETESSHRPCQRGVSHQGAVVANLVRLIGDHQSRALSQRLVRVCFRQGALRLLPDARVAQPLQDAIGDHKDGARATPSVSGSSHCGGIHRSAGTAGVCPRGNELVRIFASLDTEGRDVIAAGVLQHALAPV